MAVPSKGRSRIMQVAGVALAASVLLGCSLSPYPPLASATGGNGSEGPGDLPTTMEEVRNHTWRLRQDLEERLAEEARGRRLAGLGVLTGIGVATGGFLFGAHPDVAKAGLLGSATSYGLGNVTGERGFDQVYIAGLRTFSCVDGVLAGTVASVSLVETRMVQLNDLLLEASNRNTSVPVAEALEQARRVLAMQAPVAASSVGPIGELHAELLKQIHARFPNLSDYGAGLSSFGGAGIPAGVSANIVNGINDAQRNLLESLGQENLAGLSTADQEILSQVQDLLAAAKILAEQLGAGLDFSACGLAVEAPGVSRATLNTNAVRLPAGGQQTVLIENARSDEFFTVRFEGAQTNGGIVAAMADPRTISIVATEDFAKATADAYTVAVRNAVFGNTVARLTVIPVNVEESN